MQNDNHITYYWNGEERRIEFDQTLDQRNEELFKQVNGYYIDHNGKPVFYKNDLVD